MKSGLLSRFTLALFLPFLTAQTFASESGPTWKFNCNDSNQTEVWVHGVNAGDLRALRAYTTRISLMVRGNQRAIIRSAALQNVRDNLCEFNISPKDLPLDIIGQAYFPRPQPGQRLAFGVRIGVQNLKCLESLH